MDRVTEQFVASAALAITEAIQRRTESAPLSIRRVFVRPSDLDKAIMLAVCELHGIPTISRVETAA